MPMRLLLGIVVTVAVVGPAIAQAPSMTCEATPARYAVRIQGTDASGALSPNELPFVAGDQDFDQALANGWVFALVRAENGWSIRLYEGEPIGDAVDLTALTPPLRGAPNPRDVLGWHFRNAANTGPNDGDVNAPQELRAFVISPALAGTGGHRPPGDKSSPTPSVDDGIGWLRVIDYGLAGLQPGERARMNYLQFDACLAWPRSEEERLRLSDLASLEYTPEDRETFGGCGLDLESIDLHARHLPRALGGDLDGDGAIDEVAQVLRRLDGKRGIALCRAGAWLRTIGLDVGVGDLAPGYLDQVEAWQWIAPGEDLPRHLEHIDLPQSADGDLLILERLEKEAIAVFWRDGALQARQLYRYVEP
ncbi:MAG: hypothetical protein GY798_26810 [Hyphomicrobiales bacterium]|nr:hypothetical protein [Hyphomicrobiales bacterium]